ncbi:unnamed protein product, partial [Rotaria magnacalcarata]
LKRIAKTYHPQEENFPSQVQKMTSLNFIQTCENIHSYTEPKYAELFRLIGRQPDGVHSLVHLHAYILKFLPEIESPAYVERMSESLRDLLATWFTTGLLQVERVTWQSPCEIVQRVSEYEAVHRIRYWADLKRRLGPYRRCFAYIHHMMPNDPLVILHAGLVDNISNSIQTILNRVKSVSDVTEEILHEDPSLINSAIFYSISSTQPGLRGIELGNALIKRCVLQLQAEHPELEKFSSLSPIPDETVLDEIRPILMRHCAYYLTQVKHSKTGYARDPVANFHLHNGAVVWRLNWLADRSERGWKQSLSMMVNYRYYSFDRIDRNSIDYTDEQKIQIDEQVSKLL